MKTYGLIGKNIDYSFSRKHFSEKFKAQKIAAVYENFDLQTLDSFKDILVQKKNLAGFNVTIPYKEQIIPFLDRLDPVASEIGAVNTIKIEKDGSLTGYNTDFHGFTESIKAFLTPSHTQALILGTGGASKAIAYALGTLGISYEYVSRSHSSNTLNYEDLTSQHFLKYQILINCTPLGTHPNTNAAPPIPSQYLDSRHLVFDLIYNPPVTQLMKLAMQNNATVLNGEKMLVLQAEKSWEIWNREQ